MFQHQAKYGGWCQNISAEESLSVDFKEWEFVHPSKVCSPDGDACL